ncbi:hypothetical protein B0H34DRAFT_648995 [Crassisporium funariophilum]|nr:hypothetical protein B0H34DRAFT_648995 [Crassisporium funariophilum]
MTDLAPPVYSPTPTPNDSSGVEAGVPPVYTAPTRFAIGSSRTDEPLVKIPQVKDHLALLHAFAELRKQVEGLQIKIPNMPQDKERRWNWFVALSVERFDKWCHGLKLSDARKDLEEIFPPIDVMMVWHTYMLNPGWYAEDCMRVPVCRILKNVGAVLANAMVHRLQAILSTPPCESRMIFWRSRIPLPFDHIQSAVELKKRRILCPSCRNPILVDLMRETGTGYLQDNFMTVCSLSGCSSGQITKEKLALRKMAQDIAAPGTAPESHLAGTWFNPSSPVTAAAFGDKIKAQLSTYATMLSYGQNLAFPQSSEQVCLGIMQHSAFQLASVRALMGTPTNLTRRIMSAYNDDKVYSVELVGAVLRQGSFVQKMYDLGWTKPGFFDAVGDELALQHAIARYHAFLDLMSSSPASFFVPTLDIDLVWHTHQLMPVKYEADCNNHVRRFIDHDDKVEGLRLSSAFDITCRAWKERFNVQYTHCGCPIPGDSIGQRLSRLISTPTTPPSHLLPFNRPDLLSATHPSDHNAVRFASQSIRAHSFTRARYEKLARKKQILARKAAQKAAKNGGLRGPHSRSTGSAYEQTFLIPVPIFFAPGLGAGAGVGYVACVAGGTSVNPAGGCGGGGSVGACGGGGGNCGGGGCGGGSGGAGCGKFLFRLTYRALITCLSL